MFEGIKYALKSLLKKPFKIGMIILDYYDEKKGGTGVSIHAYHLSRELAKWGCDVHVFTRGEKKSTRTIYLGEGRIVIHNIKIKINAPTSDPIISKKMSQLIFENLTIQQISKENSKEQFNILHTHNLATEGAFISKYFHNIPWVNTFHSVEKNRVAYLEKEEKKYSDLIRWSEGSIKYADALIAVSDKIKIEILQNYPTKESKVFTIPNGVDLEFFTPSNKPQEEKKVLYIGRFSLEKGIDIIYKIAKEVLSINKKIKFEIVAAPNKTNSEKIGNLIKKFENIEKDNPRIVWHKNRLLKEEIKELYDEAIIYIQPSRYESFGMTVLEAMACGKAVICSNRGGLPETVDNAGIIIPLNTKLFVRNIIRLLNDYRLRERYSRRAIEQAKKFEWKDVALKTLNLYKKVDAYSKNKNENPNSTY